MPQLARRERRELLPDRDRVRTRRQIITEGRTFLSYGRVVYRGPSYPFLGRACRRADTPDCHSLSCWFRHSSGEGVEPRLSFLPVELD
ncbi:MAG TPA: hypothetical protein VNO70_21870 [Blastocatellia bacterium]|nr:hypothetical protein [Blastocatellia bacterium]